MYIQWDYYILHFLQLLVIIVVYALGISAVFLNDSNILRGVSLTVMKANSPFPFLDNS